MLCDLCRIIIIMPLSDPVQDSVGLKQDPFVSSDTKVSRFPVPTACLVQCLQNSKALVTPGPCNICNLKSISICIHMYTSLAHMFLYSILCSSSPYWSVSLHARTAQTCVHQQLQTAPARMCSHAHLAAQHPEHHDFT